MSQLTAAVNKRTVLGGQYLLIGAAAATTHAALSVIVALLVGSAFFLVVVPALRSVHRSKETKLLLQGE